MKANLDEAQLTPTEAPTQHTGESADRQVWQDLNVNLPSVGSDWVVSWNNVMYLKKWKSCHSLILTYYLGCLFMESLMAIENIF